MGLSPYLHLLKDERKVEKILPFLVNGNHRFNMLTMLLRFLFLFLLLLLFRFVVIFVFLLFSFLILFFSLT